MSEVIASDLTIGKVIGEGYCIGCGICAAQEPNLFKMELNKYGEIQAYAENLEGDGSKSTAYEAIKSADHTCPFSDNSPSEDAIASAAFDSERLNHSSMIGYFGNCYAGRVVDEKLYQTSSSGGIARWLLMQLLQQGTVEKVIHVSESNRQSELFEYTVSYTAEELAASATSAYHPVELSKVLEKVDFRKDKIAIIGVPCFIKAVRNYLSSPAQAGAIQPILVGIICGHLKSRFYAELLATQLGVAPHNLDRINFRAKIPGARANEKGVAVQGLDGSRPEPTRSQELFGTDYGFSFFKYKACDFCDDVFAETADVVIGDAWIERYMDAGTSLVIPRSKIIEDILIAGRKRGLVRLDLVDEEEAIQSQDAGLRHRKMYLPYRMQREMDRGRWVPTKRIYNSARNISAQVRAIQNLRIAARTTSRKAFLEFRNGGDYKSFENSMKRLQQEYVANYGSWLKRAVKKILLLIGTDINSVKESKRRYISLLTRKLRKK